ncbi:MAG: DUF4362 domain-containing protein [Lachnospiraceae bacterium]|nr:DUF4362 domain-containing protein [Lachnospiraceae bacterium]
MWYEILPRLLNMSLTASIIILFVCICRLLLKKAPKIYSYALWSVVLFRLLCPVSVSAPISLLGLFHTPVEAVSAEDTQGTTEGERVSSGNASAVEYIPHQIVRDEYQEITLPVGGSDSVVAQNMNQSLSQVEESMLADTLEAPVSLLTYLWMLGILVMMGRGVVSYIGLRGKLMGAMVLEKNIYLADHIPGPFVMGLWSPKIYLPSNLQEKEYPYIILHEQHHIRRGDHIFKVLGYLALSIHWFNPFVWIAFRLFVKDMEMSCDEAVLRKLGEEIRADYSTSLLQFAAGQKSVYGTPLAFGEGETKGRIRNLSAWKKPGRIISVVAIVLCVIAILFCFFNPTLVKEALDIDKRGVHIPELTQEKLDALYQQEFDKYSDKLPADVRFEFKTLTYNGKVYTASFRDELALAYAADEPVANWDVSLEEYPLEKICDVYGQQFIKPVYGDLNADGRYSDTYAWYDDASKVEGECRQGTIWKFGEYDPENIVALTVPEVNGNGETMYRLYIYYHLNGISLETGKDLLDKILNPMNARWYIVVGQFETNRMLDGEKPEDIYFLGDVYNGTIVTENEVKDPDKYESINISEKKPYGRILTFRDYGDGIIGYATPEGTVIYIRLNDKSDETITVQVTERNRAEEIYAQVLENYKELNRVIYLGGLETDKEELQDENGMIYFRVLDEEYQSKEDIEKLMKSVLSDSYIQEHMRWVLEEEKPLFKELDRELCIAMKDSMGIGIATHIDTLYKFDDTLLQFLGHNEEASYFVSLVKKGNKWFINELSIMGVAPTNYGRAKVGVEAYLSMFPQETEEIRAEGKAVYMSHNVIENVPEWERFLNSVQKGEETFVAVVQNTDEGDPILYYIHYDGVDFQVVMDTHRDHFGSPAYVWERYRYMSEIQPEGTSSYWIVFADEKFATMEESNAYWEKVYALYQEGKIDPHAEQEYQPFPLTISTIWDEK